MALDPYAVIASAKIYVACTLAVHVWEILTTLNMEYQRVWKSQWSLVKVLYFINRYVALAEVIVLNLAFFLDWPADTCQRFYLFEPLATIFMQCICQLILCIRVYAIYDRNRRVAGVLGVLVVAEIAVQIATATQFVRVPVPGLGLCLAGSPTLFSRFYYVPPLIVDTTLLILQIIRVHHYRTVGGTTSLLNLILRDGVLAFVTVFATNLLSAAFLLQSDANIQGINSTFGVVMSSIMGSRLVLHLRGRDADPTILGGTASLGFSAAEHTKVTRGAGYPAHSRQRRADPPQGSFRLDDFATEPTRLSPATGASTAGGPTVSKVSEDDGFYGRRDDPESLRSMPSTHPFNNTPESQYGRADSGGHGPGGVRMDTVYTVERS